MTPLTSISNMYTMLVNDSRHRLRAEHDDTVSIITFPQAHVVVDLPHPAHQGGSTKQFLFLSSPMTTSTSSIGTDNSHSGANDDESKYHEEQSSSSISKTFVDGCNNCVYDIFEVQQIHNVSSNKRDNGGGNHNQKRYGSYFVNSQIVQDGSLWVSSRVDPLFFVLSTVAPGQAGTTKDGETTSTTHKWNPKEQLLSSLATPVRLALDVKQLGHLMDTNNMGDGNDDDDDDDDLLYKVNETKVLLWLQAKYHQSFEKVKSKLVANHLAKQQTLEESTTNHHNKTTNNSVPTFSACDPSLNLDDDDDDDEESCNDPKNDKEPAESNDAAADNVKHDKDDKNRKANVPVLLQSEEIKAKQYGLQLVCEYLTEYWRIQLATSLDLLELVQDGIVKKGTATKQRTNPKTTTASSPSQEPTASAMTSTKRSWETYATTGTITPDTKEEEEARAAAEKRKKLNAAQTAGLKRLAKVNTKGMKSLTSFFGGAPSKTKNTKK